MFSVTSNPSFYTAAITNTLFPLSCIWAKTETLHNHSKEFEFTWFLHSPNNILKLNQPPFPCCNISFSFCIFKHTTMAACGWNTFMLCWAHTLHHPSFQGQKSTCFELKDQIHHCIFLCSSNLVFFESFILPNHHMLIVVLNMLKLMPFVPYELVG